MSHVYREPSIAAYECVSPDHSEDKIKANKAQHITSLEMNEFVTIPILNEADAKPEAKPECNEAERLVKRLNEVTDLVIREWRSCILAVTFNYNNAIYRSIICTRSYSTYRRKHIWAPFLEDKCKSINSENTPGSPDIITIFYDGEPVVFTKIKIEVKNVSTQLITKEDTPGIQTPKVVFNIKCCFGTSLRAVSSIPKGLDRTYFAATAANLIIKNKAFNSTNGLSYTYEQDGQKTIIDFKKQGIQMITYYEHEGVYYVKIIYDDTLYVAIDKKQAWHRIFPTGMKDTLENATYECKGSYLRITHATNSAKIGKYKNEFTSPCRRMACHFSDDGKTGREALPELL